MTIVSLNDKQFYLVRTGLELLYEADLKDIDFYSSSDHFNKNELDANLKEADDITDLIIYLRSLMQLP